jgi:hypothetical protein
MMEMIGHCDTRNARGCWRMSFIETTCRVAIPELLNKLHLGGMNVLNTGQLIVIDGNCG